MKLVKTTVIGVRNILQGRNHFVTALQGFLFAFWFLLPSHISTPVKSNEYSGIVLDLYFMNEKSY